MRWDPRTRRLFQVSARQVSSFRTSSFGSKISCRRDDESWEDSVLFHMHLLASSDVDLCRLRAVQSLFRGVPKRRRSYRKPNSFNWSFLMKMHK